MEMDEKITQACGVFFLFQVEKAILTNFSTLNSNQLPVSPYHFSQIVTQIYTEIIYLYDKERICGRMYV
jgi:hypothetical protein